MIKKSYYSGKNLYIKARRNYQNHGISALIKSIVNALFLLISARMRLKILNILYWMKGYNAIGDLDRVYSVSPQNIHKEASSVHVPFDFAIVSGSWNQQSNCLEDNGVLQMFHQHFRDGIPWEQTDHYRSAVASIERENYYSPLDTGAQTPQEYKIYLEYLDGLFQNISEEGYKPQSELSNEDCFTETEPNFLNEVQVVIGPNGEFHCVSGIHRLCIAKILELDAIPVRTRARHKKWQEIREKINNCGGKNELSEEELRYIDHPELRDIVPKNWIRGEQ